MPKAIRIDGTEVINCERGEWHYEVMRRYQAREQLTDDQIDAMIESGRLEFGGTYWSGKSTASAFQLEFKADHNRYSTLDEVSNNRADLI